MSPAESQDGLPTPGAARESLEVDPKSMTAVLLSELRARVEMLEVALRESEHHFQLVVDAVTEYAIFTLDLDGIIASWNTGAQRMKGYTDDEVLGRDFALLYIPEDRDTDLPQMLLDRARAEGTYEHTGWRLKKDGSRFWSDVVISVLLDDHGNHMGFVKIVRDRTEEHRLEVAQNSFYDTFEHDFRVPITAIRGFVELIRDADPKDQDHFVERIESNISQLLPMVTTLVDYARLRTATIRIRLQVVDMTSLAHLAVANLGSITETSRVRLSGAASVRVLADPTALARVVANLLTNALNYSPAGSDVDVICGQEDEVGVLRIVDQGRGIDERDLSSIFLEFERGRLAQDDSGTGLGLASVQRLIEQQGGTIAISSQVDVGTTVTIRLPLAP